MFKKPFMDLQAVFQSGYTILHEHQSLHEGSVFSTLSPVLYLRKSFFGVNTNLPFLLGRDGTTDVTRTMHFGTPTAYEKVRECSRGPLLSLTIPSCEKGLYK